MAEFSDDLYSANPSAVSCETANQIMKDGLRSVIMSKLAFDAFKEFGSSAAASEHDSPNLLLEPVVALLEEELTNGEVPFTTAFCKYSKMENGLSVRREWMAERLDHEVMLFLFVTRLILLLTKILWNELLWLCSKWV
jgi:hypothetical protein